MPLVLEPMPPEVADELRRLSDALDRRKAAVGG